MIQIEKNSIVGSALLIAGCCVGAGIIALPIVSFDMGFGPSVLHLLVAWIYMYFSGLMVLELYISQKTEKTFLQMLKAYLGKFYHPIATFLFLFLFYCILTSYLIASSCAIKEGIYLIFSVSIPKNLIAIVNCILFFFLMMFSTKKVDLINRFFFGAMCAFFLILMFLGSREIDFSQIKIFSGNYRITSSLPIFIILFGFQNLIPTIASYLKFDKVKIKKSLMLGTCISFFLYILWNFVVLNMMSSDKIKGLNRQESLLFQLFDSSNSVIKVLIHNFSLFAILTSLLGVALGFLNFWVKPSELARKKRVLAVSCTLFPPMLFTLLGSSTFISCLHLAGGIGTIALFGILPAIIILKPYYISKKKDEIYFYFKRRFVSTYLLCSIAIFILEIHNILLNYF